MAIFIGKIKHAAQILGGGGGGGDHLHSSRFQLSPGIINWNPDLHFFFFFDDKINNTHTHTHIHTHTHTHTHTVV